MDRILDLTESRKAKNEKSEQFRDAGDDLLLLLDRQRQYIPEEYLTFMLALAISDQAIQYAAEEKQKQAGLQFIDNLFVTARQLFETHFPLGRKATRPVGRAAEGTPSAGGRILEFPPGEANVVENPQDHPVG